MDKNQSEVDKLFADLPHEDKKDEDIFGKPETIEVETPEKEVEIEDNKEERKNRRHRRLEAQLEQERLANAQMAERLRVLSETKKEDVGTSDPPAEWTALLGDTAEARKVWQMQEKLLHTQADRIREEFVSQTQREQELAAQEQTEAENKIASELEALEELHDIDLTSDSPNAKKTRAEFLTLVEKMSPKDDNGEIVDYADFESTFEAYQSLKTKNSNTRQKEIASRSMQNSSQTNPEARKPTPGFFGWRKDYDI